MAALFLLGLPAAAPGGRISYRGTHGPEWTRLGSTPDVRVRYAGGAIHVRLADGIVGTRYLPLTTGGALGIDGFQVTLALDEGSPLPEFGSVGIAVLPAEAHGVHASMRLGGWAAPPYFGLLGGLSPTSRVSNFPYRRLELPFVPGLRGDRGGGTDLVLTRNQDRILGGIRAPHSRPTGAPFGTYWFIPVEPTVWSAAALILDGSAGLHPDVPLDLALVLQRGGAAEFPEVALREIEILSPVAGPVNQAFAGIRADAFEVPVGHGCRHREATEAGDLSEFVWSHTGFYISAHLGDLTPLAAGHLGEDYHASPGPFLGAPDHLGAPVRAAASGQVVLAERDIFEFGSCWHDVVILEHHAPEGTAWDVSDPDLVRLQCFDPPESFPPTPPRETHLYTLYGHLDRIENHLNVGDWVVAGQTLGQLANPECGGPHLHFEVKTERGMELDQDLWRGAGAGYSFEAGCAPERYRPTRVVDTF